MSIGFGDQQDLGLPTPDARTRHLARLVQDGVLTVDEARQIYDWTKPTDGPEVIGSFAIGGFDKRPAEVADSLDLSPAKLQAMQRPVSDVMETYKERLGVAAKFTPPAAMFWLGRFIVQNWNEPLGDPDHEEKLSASAKLYAEVLLAVDEAEGQGLISEREAQQFRTSMNSFWNESRARQVVSELHQLGIKDEILAPVDDAALSMLGPEAPAAAADELAEGEEGAAADRPWGIIRHPDTGEPVPVYLDANGLPLRDADGNIEEAWDQPEDKIWAKMDAFFGEEEEEEPGPLPLVSIYGPRGGLPADFKAALRGPVAIERGRIRPGGANRPRPRFGGRFGGLPDEILVEPNYWETDNVQIFNGLGYETTVLYQTLLHEAGYLDEADFMAETGFPGDATYQAMGFAMYESDAGGWIDWQTWANKRAAVLAEAEEEARSKLPVPTYIPGIYRKQDADTLTQIAKTAIRSQLGREPTAAEIMEITGTLDSQFRAQFEAEEAIARKQFEQQVIADEASRGPFNPETGEFEPLPLREGALFRSLTEQPSIQIEDPLDSFAETFERRFGAEMARGRARETQRSARDSIYGSLLNIDRAIAQ